jgi:hypothetical protein
VCHAVQPLPKSARGVRRRCVFQGAHVGVFPAQRQALARGGNNGVKRGGHGKNSIIRKAFDSGGIARRLRHYIIDRRSGEVL